MGPNTTRTEHYLSKHRTGCYECSQRRVHCDRGRPSCAKCVSKGIQCSGLGTRYRFSGVTEPKVRTCGKHKSRPHQVGATVVAESDRPESSGPISWPHPNTEEGLDSYLSLTILEQRSGGSCGRLYDPADINTPSPIISRALPEVTSHSTWQLSLTSKTEDWSSISVPPADALEPWQNYCLLYCMFPMCKTLPAHGLIY